MSGGISLTVLKPVCFDDVLGLIDDVGHVDLISKLSFIVNDDSKKIATDPNDMFRSGFCSKHAEDARPTPNVEDCFSIEEMAVVDDRRTVRTRSYGVFQHFFMNT
jgi:hypothetical protein